MYKRKNWSEKMVTVKEPQVKRVDKQFADIPAGGLMLIATPKIIEDYIRQIPKGKAVSPQTMRKDLALEYHAEYTCPVTTGIFLRIVAEANYEKYQLSHTLRGIAPFWRVIIPDSPLAKKLTFGQMFIKKQRSAEKIMDGDIR